VFEKLFTKGTNALIRFYSEEPLLVIGACLFAIFMVYCTFKLWKGILIVSLFIISGVVISIIVWDYKKTQSLEYQLAMQMLDENCSDTIELEKYLRYENITFVEGRQYRYGEVSGDKIARNYVCHESKRTYSVDFLLDVYATRPTWRDHLNDFKDLKNEVEKQINK
jgi:hypothetical protein